MNLPPPRILVIDDEPQIRKLLDITLTAQSFSVAAAASSREGLGVAAAQRPDLIILDLGLPDENGLRTLARLRDWFQGPVIILSVADREDDIVGALDGGANDYLVKPFRTGELLARIRTALRNGPREDSEAVVKTGDLEADLANRAILLAGQPLALTQIQYALLALFIRNEGKILTHRYILRDVWGEDSVDELQYLRVFVAQLRKKLEQAADSPPKITTVSGVGYRFLAS